MDMSVSSRGALIVIEGLDRAGKSTQHARLCNHLEAKGNTVKSMRFPDRSTPIGASISSYLTGASNLEDHAIHLLFSANRWEAAPLIVEAIESGITVVIDRYYYSGIVYSAAKNKADLGLQWAKAPDVGLPKPDLVIFLDIDTETAKTRRGYGDERYETEQMQARVRELFMEVMRMEGKGEGSTKIVNARETLDNVAAVVGRVADEVLSGEKLNTPLRRVDP